MPIMPAKVWLLTLILGLAMSAGAMMVMVGGVLGSELASDPGFATLPIAMMIVGTACGVVPVTRLMQRYGRKPIFIGVSLLAMCASLFAARSIIEQHFVGFACSAFMQGLALAGFQQIRFAAMELVTPDEMPKAASTVLLGGLLAAMIGPELATLGNKLVSEDFVGAFYLMAMLSFCCVVLFSIMPASSAKALPDSGKVVIEARPLSVIIVQPVFILAVSSSVVGYALMSFIMTATPVHMHVVEMHSLEHTKWVIQSHILAMYFPSLFSGWLITKLGVNKIVYAGLGAYTLTIVIAFSGVELFNYWVALILLGIGWNFLFVGGTSQLAQSYHPSEKFKVQGLNEFLVFGCQATAALTAGLMLNIVGWQGLLLSSFTVVIVQLLILNWQRTKLKIQPEY